MAKLKELCSDLHDAQEKYERCKSCGRIYKKSSGRNVCLKCGERNFEKVQTPDMGREVER